MIKSINTQFAMKVPGIEAIYTWEDVPQERFTISGTDISGSAHMTDRFWISMSVMLEIPLQSLLGENERCVDQAIRCYVWNTKCASKLRSTARQWIKIPLVHPEDNWKALCNIGADNKKKCQQKKHTKEMSMRY